jgi:hypothetical protein
MTIYYARARELMGTEQDRANLSRLDQMYPGAIIRIVSAKECREFCGEIRLSLESSRHVASGTVGAANRGFFC